MNKKSLSYRGVESFELLEVVAAFLKLSAERAKSLDVCIPKFAARRSDERQRNIFRARQSCHASRQS